MKKLKLRLEILWRLLTKSNVIFINYGLNPTTAHIVTQTKYQTKIDIAALTAAAEYLNGEIRESCEICPHCGKYKRLQGNGIMHQLCECGT